MTGSSSPEKPGRRAKFCEEQVVEAALEFGVGSFTLVSIARRLGVTTSALYRLFPSRDMIVDLCLRRVFSEWLVPPEGAGWRESLRLWASEAQRLTDTYPGLSTIILDANLSATHLSQVWDAYSERLLDSRLSRGQIIFAAQLLLDSVIGSNQHSAGSPTAWREELRDKWRWQERRRTKIPVDDLWIYSFTGEKQIDTILSGLEAAWPESTPPRQ